MERRRGIDRREALLRIGASAVVPFLGAYHPLVPKQEGPWTPRVLEGTEVDSLAALAERIVPATETPGARAANVHQYIDWVLGGSTPERLRAFRAGLAALDEASRASFGSQFVALDEERQDALLSRLEEEGDDFFDEVKALTVEGYYRSEIGMFEELDYGGNTFLSEYDGCDHDEHG